MNSPKVSIGEIVENSSLDEEQKNMWNKLLEELRDEQAQLLLESLQDHPQNLQLLTSNFQKKVEALQDQNSEVWRNIVEEEKRYLENLEEK